MLIIRSMIALLLVCSLCFGQSGHEQQWSLLAEKSNLLIVGTVEEILPIIRRDKMIAASKKSPEELRTLHSDDFFAGYMIRVRLDRQIKNDSRTLLNKVINIFITSNEYVRHGPVLRKGEQSLMFLTTLKYKEDEFKGTTISPSVAGKKKEEKFNPSLCYVVIGGAQGVERVTAKNSKSIEQFALEMKKAAPPTNKK